MTSKFLIAFTEKYGGGFRAYSHNPRTQVHLLQPTPEGDLEDEFTRWIGSPDCKPGATLRILSTNGDLAAVVVRLEDEEEKE
jgi:hypothetical protein